MTEETVNEIQWTIHTTHPDKVQSAREKLSEVVDPEIGMNIIQLGLVRDITIENDIARLKMILTTPFCPYGPAMIEMTKALNIQFFPGHQRVEGESTLGRVTCYTCHQGDLKPKTAP